MALQRILNAQFQYFSDGHDPEEEAGRQGKPQRETQDLDIKIDFLQLGDFGWPKVL